MTVFKPEVSAYLLYPDSTPVLPLDVIDGSVALDRTWSPYVQAKIKVKHPGVLVSPTSKDCPRVIVEISALYESSDTLAEVSADYPGTLATISAATLADLSADYGHPYNTGPVPQSSIRAFNLGIREAVFTEPDGTLDLDLASDEALAQDYRNMSSGPQTLVGPPWNTLSAKLIVEQVLSAIGLGGMIWHSALGGTSDGPIVFSDEARVWQPGQTAWDFIAGIAADVGEKIWCDENRIWHGGPTDYAVNKQTHVVHPTVSQVTRTRDGDDGWCEALIVKFTWTDTGGESRTKYVLSQTTPTPTKVRMVEREGRPSQVIADRMLQSFLVQERWTENRVTAPLVPGVTPEDTIDFGSHTQTCRSVEFTFPDGTMIVKV